MSRSSGIGADVKLSVVIPAFNEAARLGPTLELLADWAASHEVAVEVIVVDDGSVDATAATACHEPATKGRLRLVRFPRNRGKGAAVAAGVVCATGTHVLMYDADAAVPPSEIGALFHALAAGADVAVGSRAIAGAEVLFERSRARVLMSRAFNTIVRRGLATPVADAMCGFKLFRADDARELFGELRVTRFTFDVELLVLAGARGLRIAEVPVIWRHDPRSRVRPVRDAWRALFDLVHVASRRLR